MFSLALDVIVAHRRTPTLVRLPYHILWHRSKQILYVVAELRQSGYTPARRRTMKVHFEAARTRRSNLTQKGGSMKMIESIKSWIGALTDVGLMLLALAIVAALLVGGNLPFFGTVVGNIIALIKDLGANGLVGLIALGLIVWLFSNRSLA